MGEGIIMNSKLTYLKSKDYDSLMVAVLYGGWSDETEYTAHENVMAALRNKNIPYIGVNINDKDWLNIIKENKANVVFITNQGNFGEDGTVQGALEIAGIKYVGSGVLASAISMNKHFFKQYLNQLKINTPKWLLNKYDEPILQYDYIVKEIGTPFIVKPVSNGASVGVVLIANSKEYYENIDKHKLIYKDIILEEFIGHPKKEIGVSILENNNSLYVLPICLIEYKYEYFSNEIKFSGDGVEESFHNIYENDIYIRSKDIALKIFKDLGCSGLSRIDFVLNSTGDLFVLENNTLPGLLKNSIFPNACLADEILYDDMIEILVVNAFLRKDFSVDKIDRG